MFKIPLDELKNKIIVSGRLTPADLEKRVKEKINELSGLISEEGAIHIIANELGISTVNERTKLKIKELYPGMRSISVVGKVLRRFEVREFIKGEMKGKVAALMLGDETGSIRVVFWNDQVTEFQKIQEGDIILLKEAYVRENKMGTEVHLDKGQILINPPDEKVDVVRQTNTIERRRIQDLQPGEDSVEILGTVVRIFDPRFFFVCPRCNKRANENTCSEHGAVQPQLNYVLNLVLDDSTGTISGVFWKNQILHLLEKSDEVMVQYKDNPASFESVKSDLLGEQFKLIGRVKNNEMFQRLEFNVQMVEKADPQKEMERLENVNVESIK
ncbi:hypothetical protein HYX14_01650 [Candidatus Woesearchaeota archaeon]|nr:hypothetical protein [Candidatus Woesearchaeota archaeon]